MVQRFCAWSGPVFVLLFLLGWCLLAGLFPPPSATASASEIASFYVNNANTIRAGLLLAMASCTFYVPWVVCISAQMKRIKGVSHLLVDIQNLSGMAGMLFFLIPVMIWLAASFRPDRYSEIVWFANDLGWLMFTITFAPFVCQLISFSVAVLGDDQNNKPVFPRWLAYFNIWVAISFIPATLIVYFKSGPFAWTGLIGLWIPLILFTLWIGVMAYEILNVIKKERTI